ncbi:MAG: stage III sporulation protein AF [Bacillota bacterium]|jgi:stage III sporulation protein AF
MEIVAGIVRNVVVLVVLAVFLEMLLPFGVLSRFIRLVIGLLLLAAVLNPLLVLVNHTPSAPVFIEEDYSQKTEEILEKGDDLSRSLENQASQQYQEGIVGQIEALVLLVPGVKEAMVEVRLQEEGKILEQVEIFVRPEDGQAGSIALKQKIVSSISGFFSLDEENIIVNFQQGEAEDG